MLTSSSCLLINFTIIHTLGTVAMLAIATAKAPLATAMILARRIALARIAVAIR